MQFRNETSARSSHASISRCSGFHHPADGPELLWDMTHANRARSLLGNLDEARETLATRALDRFASHVVPLRRSCAQEGHSLTISIRATCLRATRAMKE